MTAKKCTKKCVARAKLLFCWCKPIAFLLFSLPSPWSCWSSLVDGWKRRLLRKNNVTDGETIIWACFHKMVCYRSLWRFRVDGQKRFKSAMCGRWFLWKLRKKFPFSNKNGYVWEKPQIHFELYIICPQWKRQKASFWISLTCTRLSVGSWRK